MKAENSPEVMARVHEALELVKPTAWRLRRTLGPGADVEALMRCGRDEVIEAARGYDPSRGCSFQTYAKRSLERAMLSGFRKAARATDHAVASESEEAKKSGRVGRWSWLWWRP